MPRKRDPETGKFIVTEASKTEKIWLRVPNNAYLQMIDLSNGDIPNYARQAILEKIERDKLNAC